MSRIRLHSLLLVTLFAGAIGCSDSTSPGEITKTPAELFVLRLSQATPPLFNPEQSFYAKLGADREIRISFQNATGAAGEEFLRLRVPSGSLRARPDGTPFAPGDSILMTVRVVDQERLLFELEPSGLTFNAGEPAEIKVHYDHADPDFNADGIVDLFDAKIQGALAVWQQKALADPFVRLGSVNLENLEEINGTILGLSRYAIAY